MDWLWQWKEFGFAALCLAAFAGAVWRVLSWFGNKITLPLFERGMRFIDTIESLFVRQARTIDSIDDRLHAIQRTQSEHFDVCSGRAPMRPRLYQPPPEDPPLSQAPAAPR